MAYIPAVRASRTIIRAQHIRRFTHTLLPLVVPSSPSLIREQLQTRRLYSTMGDNAANIVPPHELGSKEQAAAMKTEQPPLTDWEFKQYNRLAETMDYFHNHFRQEWNDMWNTCINGPAPQGRALADFLQKGIGFCFMLNVHHSIEEARVFPQLRRMPEFEKNELMESHHVQIHAGLESLHEYLERCQAGEAEFDLGAMRAKMETWREVLWTHLDAEVEALGAENMRKYFTIEEVRRLGM